MGGGGGLRAGLHDEDNEDEGPLLVMLGRVSFRGIGMVDGGCFFSPADGYQPLRADFHRAESQSRVVSWCKYMRLDRGRAANCFPLPAL